MKTIVSFKISAVILFFCSFLTTDKLVYHNVEGGLVKMLVPAGFKYVSKADYKPKYKDDGAPDDYYSNADRSEEVLIVKMGATAGDISGLKGLVDQIAKTNGTKVYFNDIVMMNGSKVCMLEIEGMDGPTLKYMKYVFFSAGGTTYLAACACLYPLKDKWKPVSDRIMSGIKW